MRRLDHPARAVLFWDIPGSLLDPRSSSYTVNYHTHYYATIKKRFGLLILSEVSTAQPHSVLKYRSCAQTWIEGMVPIRGTNSISTGTKIVPIGPWGPRKIFLSSKMMSSQPQLIQKRETVEVQTLNTNTNLEKNFEEFDLISTCSSEKVFVIIDQS